MKKLMPPHNILPKDEEDEEQEEGGKSFMSTPKRLVKPSPKLLSLIILEGYNKSCRGRQT